MKTTNMITMKSLYILAAMVGLQFNTMLASANFSESTVLSHGSMTGISAAFLAPATPALATFEDVAEPDSYESGLTALIPVVPMVADFSDDAPVTEINSISLAPVTPKVADFEDEKGSENASAVQDLAPVTPAAADFEETL
jgi:hypothetical protein